MAKKVFALFCMVLLGACMGIQAQDQDSAVVVENKIMVEAISKVEPLGETRHFVAYCESGKLPLTDVIYIYKIRGNEADYVVVSPVVKNEIKWRTVCHKDSIINENLVVKSVTTSQENAKVVSVEFDNGEVWQTTDLAWSKALPRQMVTRTRYEGETYRFTHYATSGELVPDHSQAAKDTEISQVSLALR